MACHTTWVTSICWLNLTYANKSTPNLASYRELSFLKGGSRKRSSLTKMTHDHYCVELYNYLRYTQRVRSSFFEKSTRFYLDRSRARERSPANASATRSSFDKRSTSTGRGSVPGFTKADHTGEPPHGWEPLIRSTALRVINDPAASAIPPWSQTEKRSGLRSLIGFDVR